MKIETKQTWCVVTAMVTFFTAILLGIFLLCGCTITLQNTSSNGKATDLIDDHLNNTPTVSTDITIPVKAV